MRNVRSCSSLLVRCYTQGTGAAKPPGGPSTAAVTGLTNNCVKPVTGLVGTADGTHYKVPEYFSYNRFSFAEAEIEMAKYRCPQPSALSN